MRKAIIDAARGLEKEQGKQVRRKVPFLRRRETNDRFPGRRPRHRFLYRAARCIRYDQSSRRQRQHQGTLSPPSSLSVFGSRLTRPVPRSQVMQAGTTQAKNLNKAVYFFSVSDEDKVVHLNFVPKAELSRTFTAKTWSAAVSAIVGGKARLISSFLRRVAADLVSRTGRRKGRRGTGCWNGGIARRRGHHGGGEGV